MRWIVEEFLIGGSQRGRGGLWFVGSGVADETGVGATADLEPDAVAGFEDVGSPGEVELDDSGAVGRRCRFAGM